MQTSSKLDTKRIQMLTDAIFAVAMTILILEIRVPEGLPKEHLTLAFFNHTLWQLLFYFFSFIILGIFWTGSHFHHQIITETDRVSGWLNIFFLMFICVIPFSTSFLNQYRDEKISVIIYSLNLIVASLFNLFMLVYAWKSNYIHPNVSVIKYKNARQRILLPVYLYVVIIIVCLLSTKIAILLFFVPIIMHLFPEAINKK